LSLLDIVREIRDQGFNLTKGKQTLSGWSEFKSDKFGPYTVTQYIPEEIYTGYSTGIGTQVTSSAGFSRKGIIVEITDGTETYSEQAFENTDFETQQGIWRDLTEKIESIVYPTTSYKKIATQKMENPLDKSGEEWRVGDVVNVSRPTSDGGGFTLGHVLRMYPTSVIVEWPKDALHPGPWTTEENKTALIFITHDADFSKKKAFSAESYYHPLVNPRRSETGIENEIAIENEMAMTPPSWVQYVTPISVELFRQTPLPKSQDAWGEHDALMKYTNKVMSKMSHVNSLDKYKAKTLSKSKTLDSNFGS
jgi:hypothetical protein|tara:strand:- start:658 stop:1581 length:924 start_codon:yes stop_codon:yes gene_type:complete